MFAAQCSAFAFGEENHAKTMLCMIAVAVFVWVVTYHVVRRYVESKVKRKNTAFPNLPGIFIQVNSFVLHLRVKANLH